MFKGVVGHDRHQRAMEVIGADGVHVGTVDKIEGKPDQADKEE